MVFFRRHGSVKLDEDKIIIHTVLSRKNNFYSKSLLRMDII